MLVDQALQFSARPRSSALTAALKTWQRNFITRQNAYAYAAQYHSTQVLDRMLLAWRLAVRRRLKIAKSARKAHNTLALRRAWCVWRFQLEQSRREALLKTFEARRLKKTFLGIIFVSNTFQALTCFLKYGCSAQNRHEHVGFQSKSLGRWLPRSENLFSLHFWNVDICERSELYAMRSGVGQQLSSMSSYESWR